MSFINFLTSGVDTRYKRENFPKDEVMVIAPSYQFKGEITSINGRPIRGMYPRHPLATKIVDDAVVLVSAQVDVSNQTRWNSLATKTHFVTALGAVTLFSGKVALSTAAALTGAVFASALIISGIALLALGIVRYSEASHQVNLWNSTNETNLLKEAAKERKDAAHVNIANFFKFKIGPNQPRYIHPQELRAIYFAQVWNRINRHLEVIETSKDKLWSCRHFFEKPSNHATDDNFLRYEYDVVGLKNYSDFSSFNKIVAEKYKPLEKRYAAILASETPEEKSEEMRMLAFRAITKSSSRTIHKRLELLALYEDLLEVFRELKEAIPSVAEVTYGKLPDDVNWENFVHKTCA